jgi:hypothetical protein
LNRVTNRFSWKFFGAIVAAGVLIAFAFEFREPAQVQAQTLKTGPAIGQKIPAFELPDHTGKTQNFESLRGPKGLLLLFHRSADW